MFESPITEADVEPPASSRPMGIPYHRVLSMVFGRPLAITSLAAQHVLAAVHERTQVSVLVVNSLGQELKPDAAARPTRRQLRGVAREPGFDPQTGIYTIAVHDKLVQRRATMNAESGLCCYDDLHAQIDAARHPDVKGVFGWADGPGGQAAGMCQVGDAWRALAKEKPVLTWVDELAASAQYGVICGSSEIWSPPTGEEGSIGVRWLHVSMVDFNAEQGLKVTEFTSGQKKLFGSPHQDLTEDAVRHIQSQIDTLAEEFFSLVAKGRGLKVDAIRGLEGATFLGKAAKEVGLVDQIGTREDAISRLLDMIRERERGSISQVPASYDAGAAGDIRATGASKEISMPINPILFAALVTLPGCSAITTEEVETDAGATKVAGGLKAIAAEASKVPELVAQKTSLAGDLKLSAQALEDEKAAKADLDTRHAELVKSNATLQAEVDRLALVEEAGLWTEALKGVKENRRENVRERAQSKRTKGQSPADAVAAVKAEGGMWAECFVATPPNLTPGQKEGLGHGGKPPATDTNETTGKGAWNAGRA